MKKNNNLAPKKGTKMKKLYIMFMLLFVTSIYSQTPIEIGKLGVVYNDSIYCLGTVAGGDSVYEFDLNFEAEWMKIFIEGNANNTVDSIVLKEGTYRYSNLTRNPSGGANPILWGSYVALKDSGLNTVNVMVNNTVGKSFTVWNPALQVYKLYFLNYWATLKTRNTTFSIVVKKTQR